MRTVQNLSKITLRLGLFQTEVATYFDKKSLTYDTPHTRNLSSRLLEVANLQPGEIVLDIATGTGLAAIDAARQVSPGGKVVGIDISQGMIEQAMVKAKESGVDNIEFHIAEAGDTLLPKESFDVVMCVSSIQYIPHLLEAVRHWNTLLKPKGRFIFQDISEDSFVTAAVLKKVAKAFDVSVMPNQAITGSEERYRDLLIKAGFDEKVKIVKDDKSSYISFDSVANSWTHVTTHPFFSPLLELPPKKLKEAERLYYEELQKLVTDEGIWSEQISYYCVGEKPLSLLACPTSQPMSAAVKAGLTVFGSSETADHPLSSIPSSSATENPSFTRPIS